MSVPGKPSGITADRDDWRASNSAPDPAAMAERVREHAEKIMKAAGSSLRHYETRSKTDILAAVMDCFEEAYRTGAAFASESLTTPASKEQTDAE